MVKKVLLIVEGDADEVKFLRSLFKNCYKKTDYKIYPYRTNIHVLAQELFDNYNDFDINTEDTDIKLVLASLEKDEQKKKLLLDKYSDVFMIFDFEPQHDHPHFDTVKRMLKFYTDSTDQGKLFINYPMMQSYKHFSVLPSPTFATLEVELNNVKRYKEIVGKESKFTDLDKYNYVIYFSIAVHQLKKANKIVNNKYEIFNINEYLKFDFSKIYDCEINLLNTRKVISVINTCVFVLIDFAPKKFFDFVSAKKDDLLID